MRVAGVGAAAVSACVLSACAGSGGGDGVAPEAWEGPARFSLDDPIEREIAPFPVVGPEGESYRWPFLGGFEVPRPQFADIDADGDLDLFVQKYTGALMYFENLGTASAPDFAWRTSRWQDLEVGDWTRFHDADGDGDLDVFHELESSYIRYVENIGTPESPRFRTVNDSVRQADGSALFADAQNIPFLVDLDCDAEVDLFLGRVDGTVSRYEFAEFSGGVPTFRLIDARFEDIEIVAEFGVTGVTTDGPLLPNIPGMGGDTLASPPGPGSSAEGPTLHGANSMAFADHDGDGDLDLFWGDFFEPSLLLIENIGSCERPNLRVDPVLVPTDRQLMTSGYNASALPDLDADGHVDLVMGVLGGAFNANRTAIENLHHYRGTPSGRFAFQTTRFLDQIDVGSDAVPSFGDLDGDGDLDLVIGSRLDPESADAPALYHFENVGTATAPSFSFVGLLPEVAYTNSAPALADLDADGDLDILLGSFNRDVRWFRNDGDPMSPRFVAASDEPIADPGRGSYLTPAVGDLDADGDLDLVVGESSGEINHFENVGTPAAPRFELVTDAISGIDVGVRSSPALVDVDGDDDLDLVVGEESRGLVVHLNVGSPAVPEFSPEALPLGDLTTRLAQPRFVDLDGDGDLDLVVGDQGGGLHFYRNGAR